MNIKQERKKQSIILILVMLLNPILVSGDVFFAEKNTSDTISSVLSESYIEGKDENGTGCHDGNSRSFGQDEANKKTECCEGFCQCGVSGCHALSATDNFKKNSFEMPTYALNYFSNHYLSLISSPSAPPPIPKSSIRICLFV
jgi:hypothetical protein